MRDQRRRPASKSAAASCMVLKFINHGTILTMCTSLVLCEWSTADYRGEGPIDHVIMRIQFWSCDWISVGLTDSIGRKYSFGPWDRILEAVQSQFREIRFPNETEFSWGCKLNSLPKATVQWLIQFPTNATPCYTWLAWFPISEL